MTTAKELARKSTEFRDVIDQHLPQPSPMIRISPEHTIIGHEVMWGGIWQQEDLEKKLRSFASITAQMVNGYDFGLKHQIRVGLTLGITPQQIKAIFYELKFYVGVPESVFALIKAQEVIDERSEWKEADQNIDHPWLDSVEEKLSAGREARRQAWGEDADRELAETATHRLVPESAAIVDAYLFGDIWARSPLSPKERMVILLSAYTCRQQFRQLRRQTGYALTTGMTKREICEVIAQSGWYRGWAIVEDALLEVEKVFEERGV